MFENKNAKETLEALNVDPKFGLTQEEVDKRHLEYGYNKLQEKKRTPAFLVFLKQFNDPMIFILLAAAVLSVAISVYSLFSPSIEDPELLDIIADPVIILSVVVINAVIGTVQENKAEKSLEALKRLSSPTCVVRREGVIKEIVAEDLVPGDIVIIEEGRTIPADLRLIEAVNLKTDESSLTGESLPVEKNADFVLTDEVGVGDRVNCAYMSTPVVYGRGEGVVTLTGMKTETGKIAKMLSENKAEQTPLQKKLAQLSKVLGLVVIILVIVIFGIQMLSLTTRSNNVQWAEEIIDNFMFSISLAVAAIPEGLPAVVTIVLALGVQKMVKANTIVRKLPSVETLGAVSVVCSDKTGTLTQNRMTVVAAYQDELYFDGDLLDKEALHMLSTGLCLCSNASIENGVYGDPTEVALVEFALRHGFSKLDLELKTPRIDEYPFDSVRKMMSTKHQDGDKQIVYTKGAMDQILKCCTKIRINGKERNITKDDKIKIATASDSMARDALRVLALAYKEDENCTEENLVFIGLVGMIDPPRPEAKDAVSIFKEAGITTIMITGDHKTTALAIAKVLGIAEDPSQAMSGDEIDKLTPEELQETVKTVRVFARVSPSNKVSIVQAIKANGNIAAMTGDGVNDAPSLKEADIGIAMNITGTDVAKGAADMVLIDDNFASIEKAVEEGRGIYHNIKKTVIFLLGSNIAEVLAMFAVIFAGLFANNYQIPTPLASVHILWVNLITDSLPAVALGADEKEKGVMKQKPRSSKESLFSRGGAPLMIFYGLIVALATIASFVIATIMTAGIELRDPGYVFIEVARALSESIDGMDNVRMIAQTCAFSTLGIAELFHMLGMTSIRKSFVHNFKTKNFLIWVAFFLGIGLQIAVVEIPGLNTFFHCYPLGMNYWLMITLCAILPLVCHEIIALVLWLVSLKKNKASK